MAGRLQRRDPVKADACIDPERCEGIHSDIVVSELIDAIIVGQVVDEPDVGRLDGKCARNIIEDDRAHVRQGQCRCHSESVAENAAGRIHYKWVKCGRRHRWPVNCILNVCGRGARCNGVSVFAGSVRVDLDLEVLLAHVGVVVCEPSLDHKVVRTFHQIIFCVHCERVIIEGIGW